MTKKKSEQQASPREDAEQLSFEEPSTSSEEDEKRQDESVLQADIAHAGKEDPETIENDAQPAEPEEAEVDLTYEELQEKVESLQAEVEQLRSESAEYLDGWQRARAEFANLKRRVEREKNEMRERIISEIISHYLDVLDDYDRALKDRPTGDVDEAWIAGLEMIRQKLKVVLESEGVEVIPTEGLDFDPNLHDAISYEESEEYENGQIIDVVKQGYRLGDRVIRPAVVRVAK